MAHSARGESSSSSDPRNSTPNWKYDVFLSFAGKDTRLKFTNHLDKAFKRSGIKTFMDDVDLERGKDIKEDLFQAIEDSLCAVIVISENYAKSTWCLEELQKILEASKILDRRVFPIFYDVDPADVRHQRKRFREAMDEHEDRFREDNVKVQTSRSALCEIADLSGWDSRGRPEADLIEKIVTDVWAYIIPKLPSHVDNLVGIESRASPMMSLLEPWLDDRRFVGIWGMGGVGKTTLAKVVFEKLSPDCEVSCFLANVRETFEKEGKVSLQQKLLFHLEKKDMNISNDYEGMRMIRKRLCDKKVLLVIDDVDNEDQLTNLAESPDWFGKGSRIIFTARDKHLLTSSRVDEQRIYEMKTMKKDESLEIFSNKAFNEGHPPDEDYLKLSKSVVEHAAGLPLALKVLGSFLHGRKKDEWRDTLDKLKKSNLEKISQVLKISYDGLDEQQRAIFLDIACFFKGYDKKYVTKILKRCDLNPTIGLGVLIDRTLLVETNNGTLEMHDLLQELGRNIGKHSRLWEFEEIKEVLENNKGSEAIEAIFMQDWFRYEQDKIEVHPEAFSKMSNLRLLLCDMYNNPFIFPSEWKFLAGALQVVMWPNYPLEALPLETQLNRLVEMDMSYSKIKQLWNNKQRMTKLKSIVLKRSLNLIEIPDLSGVPNLEHLDLGGCTSLVKVHPSLGQLRKLVEVDLSHCANLEILPKKLETNSLVKLNLRGCEKVVELPEFGEGKEKLSYLDVSDTFLTRLPESVGSLTGLEYLNLSDCLGYFNLSDCEVENPYITHQIFGLNATSLTELYLSQCGLDDGSIPDFASLSLLIVLDLSGNDFVNLPIGCFSSLSQLVFLSLNDCQCLESLPRLPPRLIRLNASGCDLMEPLSSNGQLWNLVASLDHECRGRTKYEVYDDEEDAYFVPFEAGKWPPRLRDFCAILPGYEIPSWFSNQKDGPLDEYSRVYEIELDIEHEIQQDIEFRIEVDIPPYFRDSEWCGIVVCFLMSAKDNVFCTVGWRSKAAEDDDVYIPEDWVHYIPFAFSENLCIMVLELNEETCWRHLRAHHSNSLHILFSFRPFLEEIWRDLEGVKCGWSVMCKEKIQDWCQLASSDEVKHPERVLHQFFRKVEFLIQEPEKNG